MSRILKGCIIEYVNFTKYEKDDKRKPVVSTSSTTTTNHGVGKAPVPSTSSVTYVSLVTDVGAEASPAGDR